MGLLVRTAAAISLVTIGSIVACGSAGSVVRSKDRLQCLLYYGGGGIPAPPKGATLCAAGPCNYQEQTGCSANETCAPLIDTKKDTVTPACRIAGTAKELEPCDAKIHCGAGLYCVNDVPSEDGGAFLGFCRKLCCGGDWSACPSRESCIRNLDVKFDTGLAPVHADVCYPVGTCDVFDPNVCKSEGRTCRVVDPTGAVACAPFSSLVAGDKCDREHQCGAGLFCADAPPPDYANGTCRKLCRWPTCGEPSCSLDEGSCVHFDRDPSEAGECTPNWTGAPYSLANDGGTLLSPDGSVLYETDSGVFAKK